MILFKSASAAPQPLPQSSELQVNVLPATEDHMHLTAGMYYFPAISKLSLQQVRSMPANTWSFRQSSSLYLGAEDGYTWIKIPLRRAPNSAAKWIMTIDWPLIKTLDWFHFSGSEQAIKAQGSFDNWQIPQQSPDSFPFAIGISVEVNTTEVLYLRIRHSEKALVPVTLWTQKVFASHQLKRSWYLGLFYGVLLAMFGYNISLFAFLRHKGYAAYCFYVLTMAGYTLVINGAGVAWLWQDMPSFIAHAYRLFVPLGFLGAVVFIRQFLGLRKQGPVFNLSSLAACYIWLAIILLSMVTPASIIIPTIDIFGFLNCLYGFTVAGYLWWRGDTSAKYLTISWTVLIGSTVALILGLSDFIPYQIELHYLQNIGVTIEVFLLSMALAARVNEERKMRYDAQNLALQMSTEAAKARESEIAAQERLLSIERRVKDELSLKVNEQTRELKVAMQKLQIMNKELERLSLTDPLTGLANRRHFDERLSDELSRALRNQSMVGLMLLDIDHFKLINDSYGHQAGDRVIQTLSATIQRVSGRASDLPARVGGEEFCLLVAGETADTFKQLAETLRNAIATEPATYNKQTINYTVSIGLVSLIPQQGMTAASVFKLADDALYKAKKAGRNCVMIADS